MKRRDSKTDIVTVRLTPPLRAVLDRHAKETGASLGELIRRAIAATYPLKQVA